jgi:Sec-independent protein translocase protein TatA
MEYINLVGAETVQNAASSMRQAAEEMKRAAGEMDSSFKQHEQFLRNWLTDFETILRDGK